MVGVAVLVAEERKGWQGRPTGRGKSSYPALVPSPRSRLVGIISIWKHRSPSHASSMPVPLTGTRHPHTLLVWPLPSRHCVIIHQFPVLSRLFCEAVMHTTTVFSDSCRNKCRYLVHTPVHPLQKQMEPFNVRRFHTSTHSETQLPRNANFRQCEGLPLSSRSVLMSSFTWGCSHRRSASSRSIGGKGLRGKPP
jgi:hypothetical protein